MRIFLLLLLSAVTTCAQQTIPRIVEFPKSNMIYLSASTLRGFTDSTEAKSAAVSCNSLFLGSGNYEVTNFLKQGVDYHGCANLLTLPPTPAGNFGMFDDRATGATTNAIILPGTDFVYDNENGNAALLGVVVVTQANTQLTFRGNTATFREVIAFHTSNSFLHVKNAGFLDFSLNELSTGTFDGGSEGPAFYFEKAAYAKVRFGRIIMDHDRAVYLAEPSGGVNSILLFECDFIDASRGEEAVRITGNSLTWTNRLRLGTVIGGGTPGLTITGGNNDISADYLTAVSSYPVLITGGRNRIRIRCIASISSTALIQVTGGDNVFEVSEYQNPISTETDSPGISISGGTNIFSGGLLTVSNTIAVKLSGSHSTVLRNMRIRTVNTGSGTTNWCVQSLTNGLTLANCTLQAPASTVALWSTNVANHVALEGFAYSFNAPGTNSATTVTNGVWADGGTAVRL